MLFFVVYKIMLTNTAPNLTVIKLTTNWQATASSLTDGAIQMMTARRDGRAEGARQSFRRPSPPPAASIEPVPRPLTCVTVVFMSAKQFLPLLQNVYPSKIT